MRSLGICLLVCACFCASARAVIIVNQTTSTTIFHDDFESSGPSVGAEEFGPNVSVTTSTTAPDPGPFSGTHYLSLFRDSNLNKQGNLLITTSSPQTTSGDVIRLSFMLYLNDNIDTRAQLILDDGDFTNARAWVVPDGAGNVLAVGPGFARTDTGLDYAVNTWQEWDLQYAVGSSTFSVTVNGQTATGFTSATSGQVSHADLFNGVNDPAGTMYLDDVPEPGTIVGIMSSILATGLVRNRKR